MVDNENRLEFIKMKEILGLSIKEAAKHCGIPYENAKLIWRNFQQE